MRTFIFGIFILLVGVGTLLFAFREQFIGIIFGPTETQLKVGVPVAPAADIEVVAENLDIPWEIVFLPGGDMLVTERSGALIAIGEDRVKIPIENVEHIGEGGLLGMALHPQFEENNLIYLYFTTRTQDGLTNRVERYRLTNNALSDKTIIIEDIPGARFHDGGRIAFGPDENLYITTGDAGNIDSAQDTQALSGKILRIGDDGSIPQDNPFGNEVYSYGHRNAQGITWDNSGNLWATEHGRSGGQSGMDELNRIEKGANYGWPLIEGDETAEGMKTPAVHSGASETWAPAGAAYFDGSIFFTGLRGSALYEATIENGEFSHMRVHLQNEFGRLRAVTVGPDSMLYIATSNTDGRGKQRENDDKIIRINPRVFSIQQ